MRQRERVSERREKRNNQVKGNKVKSNQGSYISGQTIKMATVQEIHSEKRVNQEFNVSSSSYQNLEVWKQQLQQ